MDSRPSIEDSLVSQPKKKAKKGKGTGPAGPKDNKSKNVAIASGSGATKGQKKNKDQELEQLEVKRKAVLARNKWLGRLTELDQDISMALGRAIPFDDCNELLDWTQ